MYSALRAFILPSMTSISRFLKGILLSLAATSTIVGVQAQTIQKNPVYPSCSGTGAGKVFFPSTNDSIYYIYPSLPNNIVNTLIPMPAPFGTSPKPTALAVGAVPPAVSSAPTFYTTLWIGASRYVQYYDKATAAWVNTGHILNSDHIAAGGGYLFGLDPSSGFVYRYQPATTPVTAFVVNVGAIDVTGSDAGIEDIAADCAGNFYVIPHTGTGAVLKKYNSAGAIQATYTLTGTFAAGAGGLAVNGSQVYYDGADGKLYSGIISGSNVVFSASSSTPFAIQPVVADLASCGYAGFNGNVGSIDTFNSCNGASNVVLNATGVGPYNWTVISGPGTITGNGSSVLVNATNTTVITHTDANCADANLVVDTDVVFIANATLKSDSDRTIYSCGQPIYDSFKVHLTNQTPGLGYGFTTRSWPDTVVIIGSNADSVIIYQITKTTYFETTTYTINGCQWKDTIKIAVIDSTPKANFQYLISLGCEADTVRFFNTSTGGIDSIAWNFRDSAGNNGAYIYSTATSPVHIFQEQGFYPVVLLVKNDFCRDTINKLINVSHPLIAMFDVDDSTICASKNVIFTDKSTVPIVPPGKPQAKFFWDFGDGTTSTLASPTHIYNKTGSYIARMIVLDYLGCRDTAYATIVVDSIPYVKVKSIDTAICQGQRVNLIADFLAVGNTGFTFDLGDGSTFTNMKDVSYAFTEAGTYNVKLTATYRYCPDATVTFPVIVRPFPGVDLGPDTVLCPNGAPVVLTDRYNLGNTQAKYLWSTGETTPAIYARNIGQYWARVDIGGCRATDSLIVNKDCYIDIPNSFSPNGDGQNDYYLPRQFLSRSVNSFKMSIFNRWGQVIFETTNLDGRGWDGKFNEKDQPVGVYVYQIDVSFDNGVKEHYTGNLTLLR
jgi:gliding motility-associated-like protein